ncbi:unnamed protein product [Cyclocybe aegerita]|uniref:F-box domain-containing protein n=1 Tax=Cyclocybe aegerita TaxID=1973307 RepID=A0A8S0XU42_CYCAE|nr:unnamed protein product [Cyclocybe aegerita]
MASEVPETLPTPEENAVEQEPSLPYEDLAELEFSQVRQGPRISSVHNFPEQFYGPVSIRNFIAGHTKKVLRTSVSKNALILREVFIRLPIELKLCVLEHLHPLDLYHFSQVSKALRRIIMDPKAAGVWKTSFEHHSGLPKPPPFVARPQWAHMLFGPGICGECGKLGALTDFGLLKRHCEPCMLTCTNFTNGFKDTCGRGVPQDHAIWSLIPRSYRYNAMRYTSAHQTQSNARFVEKDFRPMIKKITLIHLLIDNGVSQLSEPFDEYKEALSARIAELNERAAETNSWALEMYRLCTNECDNAYRDNTETYKKRLLNLGHEAQDVDYVQYSISHALRKNVVLNLTRKAFRKLRPLVEQIVRTRKENRLKVERQQLIQGIYKDYLKSQNPDSWQYLPQEHLVRDIDGFSDFLNAPFDKRGDLSPGFAASLFPDFISNWTRTQQEETVGLLPQVGGEEDILAKLRRLELVTSVFTCNDCKYKYADGRVLLGWNNICRHKRGLVPGHTSPCGSYTLDEDAVAAATALVSCVGLDPSTTTIKQMDERDDRFMCGNCMSETSRGVTGLRVYTWRECIYHVVEETLQNDPVHSLASWILLTPEAARFVKEQEHPHPHPVQEVWRCNLCAEHFDTRLIQSQAIDHVKQVHCIKEPVVGVDVVVDRRQNVRRRRPFRLGLDPAFEYRCDRCPEMGIYKLWPLEKLMEHLLKKHKISEAIEGEDWTKIKVIANTASASPSTDDSPEPITEGQ